MRPPPPPLEVPPLRGTERHTHTFILLHGRGSNGERFGRELLSSASLATRLPSVKFVFPTASKRRSTVFKRTAINQWFDNYSLEDPGQRTDLQIDGLAETARVLRALVEREAKSLGPGEEGYKRVLVGGLSQGCAASSFAFLGGLAGEHRLGAFVGMSGWLPLQRNLDDILDVKGAVEPAEPEDWASNDDDAPESDSNADSSSDSDLSSDMESDAGSGEGSQELQDSDSDKSYEAMEEYSFDTLRQFASQSSLPSDDEDSNPFGLGSDDGRLDEASARGLSRPYQALNHIRDILDLSLSAPHTNTTDESAQQESHLMTPVFLGHGTADPKVSVKLGRALAKTLSEGFGVDMTWREYEDFGHWYKIPDEIEDILKFLEDKASVPVEFSTVPYEERTADT
jgi:predicted esterase